MGAGLLGAFVWLPRPRKERWRYDSAAAVLLCCCYRPWCLAIPHAMFAPTATPRPERSHAVEFLREGSRVAAFWDVQKEHPLPRAPRWSASFLVLTGACQFGHGVGGFTINFIHSKPLAWRFWLWWVVGLWRSTPKTTHPPTCLGLRGHAEMTTHPPDSGPNRRCCAH